MPFPARQLVRDALLAYIYLNGGSHYEVHSDTTYQALADFFQLSQSDRSITRDQLYQDKRTELAWNNLVQFSRRDLDDRGFLAKATTRGIWKLSPPGITAASALITSHAELSQATPISADINPPDANARFRVEIYRILRDTAMARRVKLLHNNSCQICNMIVPLHNGQTYSEAHHIQPLGGPHNGPDIEENILIVCPMHHVQCDYGAIKLNISLLRIIPEHSIDQQFIDYHNNKIAK